MNLTSWLANTGIRSAQPRKRNREFGYSGTAIIETLELRAMLSAAPAAAATGPVISGLGPVVNYTEGAPPSFVAAHATVTESANAFASSKLTVSIATAAPGDQLGILNGNGVGMGPNGAVMYAASATATPTQVGTVAGGQGTVPLTVTFNSTATQASVQAVIDQVGFGTGVSTLGNSGRTISLQLTDGNGVKGAAVTQTVNVIAAPVINNIGPPLVFTEGAIPMFIAPQGKISDAAGSYANSKLSVGITNGMTGDQLGIVKGLGVGMGPNGTVLYSSSPTATPVAIGTVTGGTGASPLVVTFNASATQASVQAVLDQIVYGNGQSTLPTPDRHVSIVFTDGNKVSSVPVIQGIHVVPAPVIGNLAADPIKYKVGAAPVALAPTGIIADAAGAYANSVLSVQMSGGAAQDQLAIHATGALTLGAGGNLLFNGTVVGTFAGGSGSTALVIKFNGAATQASVQAVLDDIVFSYSTTGTPVLTNRAATFNFIDGNKVSSAIRTEGIQVTSA